MARSEAGLFHPDGTSSAIENPIIDHCPLAAFDDLARCNYQRQTDPEPKSARGTLHNKINGLLQLPKLNFVGSIPIARSKRSTECAVR